MSTAIELERAIDLAKYSFVDNREGNARAQAWLKVNGFDPDDVPISQYVHVSHNSLEVAVFVRNEDGTKQVGPAGFRKTFRTVDLVIRPEVYNI